MVLIPLHSSQLTRQVNNNLCRIPTLILLYLPSPSTPYFCFTLLIYLIIYVVDFLRSSCIFFALLVFTGFKSQPIFNWTTPKKHKSQYSIQMTKYETKKVNGWVFNMKIYRTQTEKLPKILYMRRTFEHGHTNNLMHHEKGRSNNKVIY